MITVSIDIGGTFTDIIIIDEVGINYYKVPTTPKNPEEGGVKWVKKIFR